MLAVIAPSSSARRLLARLAAAGIKLGLAATGAQASPPGCGPYLTGSHANVTRAETKPGLLLAGVGDVNANAFCWFARCAGGGDLIVRRAFGQHGYSDYLFRPFGGVDSGLTIVFHSRAAAPDRAASIIADVTGSLFYS